MIQVETSHSTAELTSKAAAGVAEIIEQTLLSAPRATVALTGGTLGIQILADLRAQNVDFTRVDFFFGDERFVALDHPDRNEMQGIEIWPELQELNLHRYPANGMPLDSAADLFDREVSNFFGSISQANSSFDVTILGMGPDGHVASLFPGRTYEKRWIVAEHNSPKPPNQRLSFSFEALNLSRHVFFLAASEAKLAAVQCALTNENCDLPAARVKGLEVTRWYVDEEISRGL
ncbi:MAG: 6-phosphogluconolactonase [Actinomycetota bacterium]|jgi:6-phosphogluconolactonase